MAAPIIQSFEFGNQAPPIDEVVDDLIVLSGLLVEFDSQPGGIEGSSIWNIKTLSAPMHLMIVAEESRRSAYTVVYDPFCKWTPYLAGTLQLVFAKREGTCDEQLPEWAGKRWTDVQKNWNPGYLRGF